jgi:hypothetical protein
MNRAFTSLVAATLAASVSLSLAACGGGGDRTGATAVQLPTVTAPLPATPEAKPRPTAAGAKRPSQGASSSASSAGTAARTSVPAPGAAGRAAIAARLHHSAAQAANTIRTFGRPASAADRAAGAAALTGYLDARVAGDGAKACSFLAPSLKHRLRRLPVQLTGGHSCPAAFAAAGKQSVDANIQVTAVRVQGHDGYVYYRAFDGSRLYIPIAHESGRWLLAQFNGASLP